MKNKLCYKIDYLRVYNLNKFLGVKALGNMTYSNGCKLKSIYAFLRRNFGVLYRVKLNNDK